MKRLFPLLLLCIICTGASYGQSAIYMCKQTGSVGLSHAEKAGSSSLPDVEYNAMIQCRANGGVACTRLFSDNKPGWWAFMRGRNYSNKRIVAYCYGRGTEQQAIDEVKKTYVQMGGVNAANLRAVTWFVAPANNRVLAENRKK